MIGLEIKYISKRFDKNIALDNIFLSVEDGELFFLLGPSGCGKTTLLRIIAGFCTPDEGEVVYHGDNLLNKPPEKRSIGMVFQNYSLWPHMSVKENIAYGLKIRKKEQKEIDTKVEDALAMVDMSGYEERKPGSLSGGEQQRIALARALVYEPEILLLDEPLSNLDAKLRRDMRREIRSLHERLKITMIYVTHDQEEAASMGDRIALMKKGEVEQIDTPEHLYAFPKSAYSANFFGTVNIIDGAVSEVMEGAVRVQFGKTSLVVNVPKEKKIDFPTGVKVSMIIRPENVEIATGEEEENLMTGKVISREFLGHSVQATGEFQDTRMIFSYSYDPGRERLEPGKPVSLYIPRGRIHLLGGRK